MTMVLAALNACLCALNAALYAWDGNPWNLGAAILSGFAAVFCFVIALVIP